MPRMPSAGLRPPRGGCFHVTFALHRSRRRPAPKGCPLMNVSASAVWHIFGQRNVKAETPTRTPAGWVSAAP